MTLARQTGARLALLLSVALLNRVALAFWTVDCGIVSVEKSDPIRFPGQQSPHTHVVAGSSAYGPDATSDLLRGGDSCTSCDVQQDKSAYWTNQLYVAPPEALGLDEAGIVGMGGVPIPTKDGNAHIVYYKLITKDGERSNNDLGAWEPIVAFPSDMKMFVNEAMIREKQKSAANVFDAVLTYKCLGYGDQADTFGFPSDPTLCTQGLRAQLTLPSCWNGQSSTAEDASSHVAYPTGSWAGSPCPESHPIRLPTLFYEVLYDMSSVGTYINNSWVLQYPLNERSEAGDPLFHADFMNGWDQTFLQQALDECGVTPCPLIQKVFSACVKTTEENIDGPGSPGTPPSTPAKCTKPRRTSKRWDLLFSDEFDGETLDRSKWSFDLGDGCQNGICAWGNDEFQYYTNSSRNAYVRDGVLRIHSRLETGEPLEELRDFCRSMCVEHFGTAESFDQAKIDACAYRCDFQEISSARIKTKDSFSFAPRSEVDEYKLIKVEVKLRTTAADGLWPAAWALPTDSRYGIWAASGEIDIYESANDQSIAHGTIHYGGQWPSNTYSTATTRSSAGVWHRALVYWDVCSMRWRLDGRQFASAKSGSGSVESGGWYSTPAEGYSNSPNAPFDSTNPFHLLLNQAVGGRFTGSMPYPAVAAALRENPDATFEIDYVRVYGMK